MFGVVFAADSAPRETLAAVAREFSPRIEVFAGPGGGVREVVIDLAGLERLFGDARTIAEELRRTAADRGLRVRVAIAATRAAARLVVRSRAGIGIVDRGTEAATLAPLPLSLLGALHERDARADAPLERDAGPILETLRRWGLRTLGELASLAADEVAARLGQEGVAWQRLARGEDAHPLVPALPEERFEQSLDLEWPIEGIEPLSFVLARLMEPLETHLARRDRGAAVLHVRLHLVTREVYARSLHLPAPMRDARALRTLALLDLESHPPGAAIDRVVVAVDPTPGRVVQFSLLTRALPTPERLSTLMARLAAVMGEGRCGSPAPVDSWRPGEFAMVPFAPRDSADAGAHSQQKRVTAEQAWRAAAAGASLPVNGAAVQATAGAMPGIGNAPPRGRDELAVSGIPRLEPGSALDAPVASLRRYRAPVPARVTVVEGRPVRVTVDRPGMGGGRVDSAAGPWRTSGAWWRDDAWERDEWDVTAADGATYRIFRERDTGRWFVEGLVD